MKTDFFFLLWHMMYTYDYGNTFVEKHTYFKIIILSNFAYVCTSNNMWNFFY